MIESGLYDRLSPAAYSAKRATGIDYEVSIRCCHMRCLDVRTNFNPVGRSKTST